jgi:hypothetical protein
MDCIRVYWAPFGVSGEERGAVDGERLGVLSLDSADRLQ